jgi:hypothetical protein
LLLEKVNDPSARVAFQATLSLGAFPARQVAPALSEVIEKYGRNPWFRTAVLSSEAGSSLNLLELLEKRHTFFEKDSPEKAAFLEDFAYIIGSRNQEGEVARFLEVLSVASKGEEKSWRLAGLNGLAKGMKTSANKQKADTHLKEVLHKIQVSSTSQSKEAIQDIGKLLE